jgi:O-antigen/teichoic acid export membrane protein
MCTPEAKMWRTDTPWFIVALIMAIFAIGGVLFGKFEQHKPRGRRVVKQVLVLAAFVLLDAYAGRSWAYGLLVLMGVVVVYVHGYWLPKRGINGWTAEPYDTYLALITGRSRADSSSSAT